MDAPLLVCGRWVITGASGADPVLEDGAALVNGDRVREIGPRSELQARHPTARIMGGDAYAVLPGLVNAHHHSHGASHLQQSVADDLLESWLFALKRLRSSDVRLDTLISAARLLRSGVTTVVDVHSDRGTAAAFSAGVDRALRAYDESGMRVAFAAGYRAQSFLVAGAGEDRRFIEALPPSLQALAEAELPGAGSMTEDEYLGLMADHHGQWAAHPRIDVWLAPPGPQWVSDAFMQRIAHTAARLGTGIQTHVVESFYERLHGERSYGRPTLLHLEALGVLGPRVSIAHGTWLTEAEIEVMVRTGAAVSHNPSSNLRLRAGIAPFNALLDAGVTTGLGMDGTTLNDDEDMFTEMRLALHLQCSPQFGLPVPAPEDVFAAATAGGAKLLGKDRAIGRIAEGYRADLVLIAVDQITWPWVAPEVDPRALVLLRAQGRDVHTVLVNGEIVLENREPTRFDLSAVSRELADRLDSTAFPAQAVAAAEALRPRIESWYREWDVPALAPWTEYNSKR